jgi:hypothetical protein
MRKWNAIAAALLSCGVVLSAGAAGAADMFAGQRGCVELAQQVRDALASSSQSSNYDNARKEQGFGRDFCNNGLFAQGISHYQNALNTLGKS